MTGQSATPYGRIAEVLLVEDSFGDAMLAEEAFTIAGSAMRLTRVVSGEEALSWLAESPKDPARPWPDLILFDLGLPRMDGKGLLKALKSDPATRAISVVVLTGSDSEADISECYQLGADAYLVAAIDQHWLVGAPLPARTPRDAHNVA